jgi:hypothetical protein
MGFRRAGIRTILVGDMRGLRLGARRARFGAGALVAAAAVTLSACTGSGYQYVKNGSNGSGTYFKVPNAWRVYDENAFIRSRHLSPTKAKAAKADSWTIAFDASSKPSLKHFNELATKEPFGIAEVRKLDPQERDSFSLMAMRNYFVPVDDLAQNGGNVVPLRLDDFTRDGGFHGLRFTFEVTLPTDKESVTVDQVSIIDAGTKEIHFLAVSCSSSCYDRKKDTINKIVDSWTVKER